MYQFTDAIGKVKFDEEFSDVVDNIKNDCKQLECMSFSDAVIKINEWIDKVFSPCKCSIIDYPEWFKIVVWRIIYNELKTNPQARQTELIEDNINLPKDVFGKKYWNMYSPDMKLQQEEYDNLFLPFNYAQVECNHIYRAMIHHIICSAVVPMDTIVDVFGKLGLVPALCANGYKHKKVWVNKRTKETLTKIQLAFKRKLRIYKYIERVQKFLKSSYPNEQKEKVSEIIGLAGVLFSSYIDKNEFDKYDIYFLSAYFIMYKCLLPEYWIDSNLEVWKTERLKKDDAESKKENSSKQEYELTNNKKIMYDTWISHWIDEGRGYKDRVERFINLSKSDLFTFMDRFSKLEFCCEKDVNVADEGKDDNKKNVNAANEGKDDNKKIVNVANNDKGDNKKNIKEFLYIDMPKYITEYERFNFDTKKMGDVFEMLSEYEGEWILPWKTYVEKDIRLNEEKRNKKDTEISSVRDRMYTKKRELTDSAYCTDILSVVEDDINIKDIYDTMKNIDERHNLFVFDYRDKDKNKPQSIVFITNIDFEKVDDIQFQTKYNLDFEYNGRLRKRTFKEFYEEMTKWIPS